MQSILQTALISCLPVIAGCIAILPIAEFIPVTAGGKIHTSNCIGAKSVHYDFDGVPVWVTLHGSGAESPPSRLRMGLTLADGHVARIPAPEIRIKAVDERPEESFALPAWERSVLRRKKPNRDLLERVVVEIGPPSGPLIGGMPNDGSEFLYPSKTKSFLVSIPLGALPAPGYRIQLPSIEINGKVHNFAPIEYRHQYRVEFMVPVNC